MNVHSSMFAVYINASLTTYSHTFIGLKRKVAFFQSKKSGSYSQLLYKECLIGMGAWDLKWALWTNGLYSQV